MWLAVQGNKGCFKDLQQLAGLYLKEYEKNLKTFNRLFGENDKSFFKVLEEKTNTNKPPKLFLVL